MSNIRLRYSGLINFASRIISVATGLMFTLIVTRRLSEEAFGTWQFYTSILLYFTIPSGIVNYWLVRDLGRGKPVAKSGILFTSGMSLISTVLFLILLPIISSEVSIDIPTTCAFVLWIIIAYHTWCFGSVFQGVKPQVIGYGTIIFEISKVVIGTILVGYMRLQLFGAVLSIDLALLMQTLYYSLRLPKRFKGRFSLDDVRRWLKMVLVPLILRAPGLVAMLDVVILTLITGSLLPVAYVKAVSIFAMTITFSEALTVGLYPKLLSGGASKDIEDSIEMVLMFLIPMVLGQLVLAEPLLYLLRKEYGPLHNVLRIALLCYATIVFKEIFSMVIQGIEKIDASENIAWKEVTRSYLMKIPLIELFGSLSYVAILYLTVKILNDLHCSPALISLASIFCSLLVNIILVSYYLKISRNLIKFHFNFSRISKFLVSGVVMSLMLLLFYPESAKSEQIFIATASLMPVILLGVIVYFTVLFAIDSKSRGFLTVVLKSLKIRKSEL
ncbi:MAG: hypothetical protein ABIM44_03870 [candidate division WOR-3 bacterium]